MARDPCLSATAGISDPSTDADSGDNLMAGEGGRAPPPPPHQPPPPPPRAATAHGHAAGGEPSANAVLRSAITAPAGKGRSTANEDRHHKWLNRQITAAADLGDMEWFLQVVDSNLQGMNLINFSTGIHRAAKLALGCSPAKREQYMMHPAMLRLKRAIVECVTANIAPNGTWIRQRRPEDQASEMRCLSIICWSCATIRMREESLFQRAAAASQRRISELKPFELSNMLWSFAKLSLGDPAFFNSLAPHLLRRREGEFSSQCLSTIVWAFGTVKAHHHGIFASFTRELIVAAPTMATQGIANTAWAFARVRRQEGPLFRALAEAACREHVATTFKPQELSNTVWAFATVGFPHPQLFTCLAEVSIGRRWELPPQNIANMLWAYAKLAAPRRDRLFPALLEVTVGRLELYKPQEVSAILWASAREVIGGGTAAPVCRNLFHVVPKHFAHRLPDFTSQALACMAEAFTLAGVEQLPFFELIIQESLRRLYSFQPPSLCTLLRGLTLCACKEAEGAASHTHLDVLSQHIVSSRLVEMQPHNILHLYQSLDLLPKERCRGVVLELRDAPPLAALERTQPPPARLALWGAGSGSAGAVSALVPPGAIGSAEEELLDPLGGGPYDDDLGFGMMPPQSTAQRPNQHASYQQSYQYQSQEGYGQQQRQHWQSAEQPEPQQQQQESRGQQARRRRKKGNDQARGSGAESVQEQQEQRPSSQAQSQEWSSSTPSPLSHGAAVAAVLGWKAAGNSPGGMHDLTSASTAPTAGLYASSSGQSDMADFRLPPGLESLRHAFAAQTTPANEAPTPFGSEPPRLAPGSVPDSGAIPISKFFSAPPVAPAAPPRNSDHPKADLSQHGNSAPYDIWGSSGLRPSIAIGKAGGDFGGGSWGHTGPEEGRQQAAIEALWAAPWPLAI